MTVDLNHQREGAISNAHVGKLFEVMALQYLNLNGIPVKSKQKIEIGLAENKTKIHEFDLGSDKVLVECKAHRWTKGNNVPSAKFTVWNEAMYFFHLVKEPKRKIFFFEKHTRDKNGVTETMGEYYIRNFSHLIPVDVEFWEFDLVSNSHKVLKK